MTYYTSWFFFVLIIDTICEDTGANRCKVTTNIHLGSPWYLAWMRPLMLWSLKRNHEVLVSEDFPMRNRRGLLRDWGYGFKVDGSYENSMDVTRSNVIFPKSAQSFPEVNLVLDRDLPNGSQYLAGREDHLGLRLVRQDEEIRLFPRLCPHEGACLDASSCKASKIICHWHGRIFNPMAVLNVRTSKHILTEYHEIRLENGTLTLKVKAG